MLATLPIENQIIVSVEDASMMKELKKAIGLMRGVAKVTVPRRRKLYSAYELSMRDLKEGRVNSYDSVDDFFQIMINTGSHSDLFSKKYRR